jgi:hypothetical protein
MKLPRRRFLRLAADAAALPAALGSRGRRPSGLHHVRAERRPGRRQRYGTEYPGSPLTGGGLPGPLAVAVAGDDTV